MTAFTTLKRNSNIRKISYSNEKHITISKHNNCSIFSYCHKHYAKTKVVGLLLKLVSFKWKASDLRIGLIMVEPAKTSKIYHDLGNETGGQV